MRQAAKGSISPALFSKFDEIKTILRAGRNDKQLAFFRVVLSSPGAPLLALCNGS
jgi:hypothetical protein